MHGSVSIQINHNVVWKRYVWRYVFDVFVHSQTFIGFHICLGIVACNRSILEHSAILLTYIKQYLVLKTNFQFFLEWLFYTGFSVLINTSTFVHL